MRDPLVARAARAALVAGALAASACNLGGGTEGELGHGRFFYACVDGDDLFCSALDPEPRLESPRPPVPEAVVVGARFALEFDLDTIEDEDDPDGSLSVDVECAVDEFEEQRHVRPTREGWLAFVAERSDGAVADILHVLVATPARIDVATSASTIGSGIALTEPTAVAAIPYGTGGQVLYGAFDATWSSSDHTIVTVHDGSAPAAPSGPLATLVPVGTGEAIVSVTVAGVERQIVVDVQTEVTP